MTCGLFCLVNSNIFKRYNISDFIRDIMIKFCTYFHHCPLCLHRKMCCSRWRKQEYEYTYINIINMILIYTHLINHTTHIAALHTHTHVLFENTLCIIHTHIFNNNTCTCTYSHGAEFASHP